MKRMSLIEKSTSELSDILMNSQEEIIVSTTRANDKAVIPNWAIRSSISIFFIFFISLLFSSFFIFFSLKLFPFSEMLGGIFLVVDY